MLSREIFLPSPRTDHPTVASIKEAAPGADEAGQPSHSSPATAARTDLLTLRLGVPTDEALALAAVMLASAIQTARRVAQDNDRIPCLWTSLYLLDTVASVLDASLLTIYQDRADASDRAAADAQDLAA